MHTDIYNIHNMYMYVHVDVLTYMYIVGGCDSNGLAMISLMTYLFVIIRR